MIKCFVYRWISECRSATLILSILALKKQKNMPQHLSLHHGNLPVHFTVYSKKTHSMKLFCDHRHSNFYGGQDSPNSLKLWWCKLKRIFWLVVCWPPLPEIWWCEFLTLTCTNNNLYSFMAAVVQVFMDNWFVKFTLRLSSRGHAVTPVMGMTGTNMLRFLQHLYGTAAKHIWWLTWMFATLMQKMEPHGRQRPQPVRKCKP